MKCSKCGKEIQSVNMNMFNQDGSDEYIKHSLNECEQDAVVIETSKDFTGYELDEKDIFDCIECPHCRKYPFDEKIGIEMKEVLVVICFKKNEEV